MHTMLWTKIVCPFGFMTICPPFTSLTYTQVTLSPSVSLNTLYSGIQNNVMSQCLSLTKGPIKPKFLLLPATETPRRARGT